MKNAIFISTFFLVSAIFSQNYIQTSSIRINSDFEYYSTSFKKIFEFQGQKNLKINIYQKEFSIENLEDEEKIPAVIQINDQYLPLNLGFENTFQVKELVGGALPELLIYSVDYCQAYCGTRTYIVNINAEQGFVLSDLGIDVSVISAKGKVEYYSSESENTETFEYEYSKEANDLYIYNTMLADTFECFNAIIALTYNNRTGYNFNKIMKKLPAVCVACFVGNMSVSINNYEKRPISELKVGDKILTYDFELGKNKEVIIEEMIQVKHGHFIDYVFDHGTITATPDHPFYAQNKGWASSNPESTSNHYKNYSNVAQIAINDEFILNNGEKVKLQSIIHFNKNCDSYTISKLSDGNSFYVNNVLVGTEEIIPNSMIRNNLIKRK